MSRLSLQAKYLLGRCLAVAGLAVLLPLLALIALAVLATSPGPVLFRQRRVGEGGREFTMFKFRTMSAAAAPAPAAPTALVPAGMAPGGVEGDDRRTEVGRLLRRTSLDELPQLWNVVRGDMALVGPRPERPEFVTRFSREVEGYGARHRLRPGLTGLAQVRGSRGRTPVAERAALDNAYIDGRSLALDVRILAATVGAVLRGAE